MGVGTPVNILEGIERGVDMFDCVMPTRNGRNGMLFTKDGIMNMRNKKWEADFSPIEADGASYVDTLYSKAYLRHLFHAQEFAGHADCVYPQSGVLFVAGRRSTQAHYRRRLFQPGTYDGEKSVNKTINL